MTVTTLMHSRSSRFAVLAVALTTISSLFAIIAWGQAYNWYIPLGTFYALFPVFGLLAFSIMWSQYMVEAAKNLSTQPVHLKKYFRYTSYAVLVAILLHPSLLIAQRFKDGYGLPPASYLSYVVPAHKWLVVLGSLSFMVFLAFSLKHWLDRYSWWRHVLILNDIAILAIFYHGLRLGTSLHHGWFQMLWYFYGVTLVAALSLKYYKRLNSTPPAGNVL